jgi:hypothetical protein
MNGLLKSLFFFLGTSILLSCTDDKKSYVHSEILPSDTVKLVLYELYLADEINASRDEKDTSLQREKETLAYYRKVFEDHRTSYEQFMKSMHYYMEDPKRFNAMTDSLNQYARKMSAAGVAKFINKTIHGNHFKDTARSLRR